MYRCTRAGRATYVCANYSKKDPHNKLEYLAKRSRKTRVSLESSPCSRPDLPTPAVFYARGLHRYPPRAWQSWPTPCRARPPRSTSRPRTAACSAPPSCLPPNPALLSYVRVRRNHATGRQNARSTPATRPRHVHRPTAERSALGNAQFDARSAYTFPPTPTSTSPDGLPKPTLPHLDRARQVEIRRASSGLRVAYLPGELADEPSRTRSGLDMPLPRPGAHAPPTPPWGSPTRATRRSGTRERRWRARMARLRRGPASDGQPVNMRPALHVISSHP